MGRQVNPPGGVGGPRTPGTAVALARSFGARPPAVQLATSPTLIGDEQELMVRCEAAIENLKFAFWAAGKALQVVRDTKLFRASFATFEEYVEARWDFTPQYANRLIKTWKIAEAVFDKKSNDLETIVSRKLNQAQCEELVELAEEHGTDAAALLYLTVAKAVGVKVSAKLVAGAAASLPVGAVGDRVKTEASVAAYLSELESPKALPSQDALKALKKVTSKLNESALRAAMETSPDATRAMVTELIESLSSSVGISVEIKSGDAVAAT
ncbi:hypothetical protein [Streptomyces xanthophaeus]